MFTAAQRLEYFVDQYGYEAGVQAFYADQAHYPNRTTKGQARLNLEDDGSKTFYAVLSTPITARS